jgi:hypothetical protein
MLMLIYPVVRRFRCLNIISTACYSSHYGCNHNDHAIGIEHAVYCSWRYSSINFHPSLKYPQHVEFEYSDATLNTLYLGAF